MDSRMEMHRIWWKEVVNRLAAAVIKRKDNERHQPVPGAGEDPGRRPRCSATLCRHYVEEEKRQPRDKLRL